ncbi:MAG: acyl-CoA dehydrogenase family protein, partial [bacterium]
VVPVIGHHWLNDEFPMEWISRLAGLGAFGPTLPREYGGHDLGSVASGLIMQELERGDSGLRSFASVQTGLVMYPVFTYGSVEQKKRWLPKLARGEAVGCFGLTEPDAGSDPGSMKTIAARDGSDWLLTGSKMWITNGSIADLAVVWAKDESGVIRGFLVEKGMPGFAAQDIKGKMSLRASVTSGLYLDHVRVPEANRLPQAEGLKGPLSCLTQARFGIAWGVIGAATACYSECLEYARKRVAFGKPIASFQLIQEQLVDILEEITKAQWLAYRLAQLKDAQKMTYEHVCLAKRNNVRMALETARKARSILGAGGITIEYQSLRHALNLESVYTYEGTHEIQTLIIGRDITGISSFD